MPRITTTTTTPNPSWKRLTISNKNNTRQSSPHFPLFFQLQRQGETHDDGLQLHVTDLIHLWTAAKTTKQDLIDEAARIRCRIDPSEDEEQYQVLIGKLEEAVSGMGGMGGGGGGGGGGGNGAQVRLSGVVVGGGKKTGDRRRAAAAPEAFELETSIPLPASLGVLEWRFCMRRRGSEVLTRELVLPVLRAVDAGGRREEELRRRMREKDHVIAKLMDKIEGSGIDLGMVFPGFVGSKKGLSAKQAARVVPGIEFFKEEEEEWEGDLWGREVGSVDGILEELRDEGTGEVMWREPLESARWDFGTVGGHLTQMPVEEIIANQIVDYRSTGNDTDSDIPPVPQGDDGEFDQLRSSSSSPAPVTSREPSSIPRGAKLGALGGIKSKLITVQKRKSSSGSPEPEQFVKSSRRRLSSSSTDTATASETESMSAGNGHSPEKMTPKKPVSKIGIIKGKKPQVESSREGTASPGSIAETRQSIPSKVKPKLGAIGGKNAKPAAVHPPPAEREYSTASPLPPPKPAAAAAALASVAAHPPVSTANEGMKSSSTTLRRPSTPPKPEEAMTEAEKANQKRLELKRQLDEGARKKKKRKF